MAQVETSIPPDQLGPDLETLLDGLGTPILQTVSIMTMPAPGQRKACFRVTLADGQILKARRMRTPIDVDRITRLLSVLDARYFPPVLARHGCALLTRWVPGAALAEHEWTAARLRECAALQATLHRLPVSAELAPLRRRPTKWEQHLNTRLGELVGRQALEARQARQIELLALAEAPSTAGTAICHTDFCGQNVIVADTGEVCVIDNEAITVDAPEYDLARTWYRWPLTPSQQQTYADGYGAHAHVARFAAHFLHWALLAVVDSAAFRTRIGAASAHVPLERLASLLRTRGQDEPFVRFLRSA